MLSKLKTLTALVCTFGVGLAIGKEVLRNHELIMQAEVNSQALAIDLTKRYSKSGVGTVFTMVSPYSDSSFFTDHQVKRHTFSSDLDRTPDRLGKTYRKTIPLHHY